jgi:hypothetical protein
MKDLQVPYTDNLTATTTHCTTDDDCWQSAEFQAQEQTVDSEFLDALCNGVIIVGDDMKIVSQNYISKVNMGDLRGKDCFRVLENRDSPCEHCPRLGGAIGDFETSMRCAGSTCTLYEVRIYQTEEGIAEVYPDMVDRDALLRNMDTCSEELEMLRDVVENIRVAITDDVPVAKANII